MIFERRTLNECLQSVIDRRGVTPKKLGADWTSEGYRVFSANNVKSSGLQNLDEIRYVDEETYHKWMKNEIQREDILLTSEAPAGEVWLWNSNEKIVVGQRLYALRTKADVNPWYLAFYLQSKKGQMEILNKCSGSTVFGISAAMFDLIEVLLPDKDTQDKIANILKHLVEKINYNVQSISVLRGIVNTLFSYWFIQFDFPDENGKPYKSSGGKMIWSDEIKRELPATWQVRRLHDIAEYVTEKISNEKLDENTYVGNDNMLNEMGGKKYSEYVPDKGVSTKYKAGDVLVGNIRPYFHKIWRASCTGGCSPDVLCLRALEGIPSEFLFAVLARKSFFDYDTAGTKGSKMPRGDKTHIMNYPVVFNKDIAEKFANTVGSILPMVEVLQSENQELSSLRDFLIPLLMNGQVTFKEKEA